MENLPRSEAEYYHRLEEEGAPPPSLREQVSQWVIEYGSQHPHIEWLTSPLDSEERNPFFTEKALQRYRDRNSPGLACPNNCGNYLQFADDEQCSWCQEERDAEQEGE